MNNINLAIYAPSGEGRFNPLSHAPSIRALMAYYDPQELDHERPRRKSMVLPEDMGAFIKPLKQCFIRNPRLSPMTRMMLILLSGWNGSGQGGVETTIGTIAEHLCRSRRMVFHYLKDAMEEGYLSYSRIKNRMGYYIGIKIYLNFDAIRKSFQPRSGIKTRPESRRMRDVKQSADTNNNLINTKRMDEELMSTLARFAYKAGYISRETLIPDS